MFQREKINQNVEGVKGPQIDRSWLQKAIAKTMLQDSSSLSRDAGFSASYLAYRFIKGFLGQPHKTPDEPKQSDEDKAKKLSDVGVKKVIISDSNPSAE